MRIPAGKIYTETGRHVVTLVQDVNYGDLMMAEHFELPDGSKPRDGDVMPHDIREAVHAYVDSHTK